MTNDGYETGRARGRFAIAAAATAVAGLLAGWSPGTAVRRAVLVGAAVAAGDYALSRLVGDLDDLGADFDASVEEVEVDIGETATGD